MTKQRDKIPLRSTPEREQRIHIIQQHLIALGINASRADAIDFALRCAVNEIAAANGKEG